MIEIRNLTESDRGRIVVGTQPHGCHGSRYGRIHSWSLDRIYVDYESDFETDQLTFTPNCIHPSELKFV